MKNRKKALMIIVPLSILVILIWRFVIPLSQWYINADDIWDEYEEDYGSFTPHKSYSYDNVFYAVQEVEKIDDIKMIKVCIHETESDEMIYSFYPARAWDFWGICWESDSYNIWTQSADIGIFCYKYDNKQWLIDKAAVRPPDIISKYDD